MRGNLKGDETFQILNVTAGGYAQVYVPRTRQYGYMELRSGRRLNVRAEKTPAGTRLAPTLTAAAVERRAGYNRSFTTAPMKARAGFTYTEPVRLKHAASDARPLRIWGNARGTDASNALATDAGAGFVRVRNLTRDGKWALVRHETREGGQRRTHWGFVRTSQLDPGSLAAARRRVAEGRRAFAAAEALPDPAARRQALEALRDRVARQNEAALEAARGR